MGTLTLRRSPEEIERDRNTTYKCSEKELAMDALVINQLNTFPCRGGRNIKSIWSDEALDARDTCIYKLLRKGYGRQGIVEVLSERWGCSKPTVDKYYKEALNNLKEDTEQVKNAARKIATERLNEAIIRALDKNRIEVALKAQDQLNKINGLYSEKKEVEITGLEFKFGE